MLLTSSYFSLAQVKVIVEKTTSADVMPPLCWPVESVLISPIDSLWQWTHLIFGGLTLEEVVQNGIRKSAKETMNSKLVCNTPQRIRV